MGATNSMNACLMYAMLKKMILGRTSASAFGKSWRPYGGVLKEKKIHSPHIITQSYRNIENPHGWQWGKINGKKLRLGRVYMPSGNKASLESFPLSSMIFPSIKFHVDRIFPFVSHILLQGFLLFLLDFPLDFLSVSMIFP